MKATLLSLGHSSVTTSFLNIVYDGTNPSLEQLVEGKNRVTLILSNKH